MIGLGRFEQAANLFATELERHPALPPDDNSRTRFTLRQATAMASINRLDQACHVIETILPTIGKLDSATIRTDLGRFVARARTRQATTGQRDLILTAAAIARGRRQAQAARR